MRTPQTALDIPQAFCHAWFEARNLAETVSFLADSIDFVGTGTAEYAQGIAEMTEYIRRDIQEIAEPFAVEVTVIHQHFLTDRLLNIAVKLNLRNTVYFWPLRGFFTLAWEQGSWLIQSLHFSEPSPCQRGTEHYPGALVMENIARQRLELMDDSLPGGMMGGYLAEGFPFYFINRKMLAYLGYDTEEEFVADINGLVSNCMHPNDREMVDESVTKQLESSAEYVVEYRMRKKDGSYIWVHDVGRVAAAEDGRPAITSVCMDITAQKQAQAEVLHLYNNIPGAVFRCRYDADFSIIDANDGLFEFLGYTRQEFAAMGNRVSAVCYPEDLPVLSGQKATPLSSDNTYHREIRVICKNGAVKWVSNKAQLLTEEDGEQYFYCVFVDITEEKHLQEQVRELYKKELSYFAEIAAKDGSFQGIINVTKNRLETYMASADVAVAQVGNSYDETIETLAASAVDPAYGNKIRGLLNRKALLADYEAGKVSYELDFLRRSNSGKAFWANTNFRTTRNPETGDILAFFYTLDVTEKKLQEQLLNKIAKLDYDIITEIDIVQGSYWLIAYDSAWVPSVPLEGDFQKEIRLAAAQCMGEEARTEFLYKLDFTYMKTQLEKQDFYSMVLEMTEGHKLRVKKFQVFYVDKELGRVCMTRTDVTDIVRQEQTQKEALTAALAAAEQANAAKTDFLSRMSHEIRTPMNAIIGMSTIAAQHIGDDEQVQDCISKIGISSRFLLSLINDILDMSRIESGKILLKAEKFPIDELINRITSICYAQAAAKGVEYECIVDSILNDYYIGDAMKLQQVLINILSNAIKFTDEGGKIIFSATEHTKTKNDAVLRFVISDTGVGMNEDFLPHIFEPFSQEYGGTTALYGGTGLGLAISKNIVDMMDGKIAVRSIKGIGTEFTVDVKLGITEEEKLRHKQKKQNYNFSHLKTLVVDDDVTVCESAVATLKEMGIKAEWVDSGRKAVNRVKHCLAENRYYDMILIDWKMPDMDGIETARQIRAMVGPDVTIIIITAYDWIAIEHEAKMAGVNLLMSKPMFKSSLVSAFTKALGEKDENEQLSDTIDYDFAGKCVLLVEDNPLNTEVAKMLLESKGVLVETAENGLRALEMFSKSQEGAYSAILMDIRMPIMDGLTAAVDIRHLSNADAKSIPIIAMTANAFDDDIEKSKAAGMNAHLAKPIEPERLYQTLYDFIFEKEN